MTTREWFRMMRAANYERGLQGQWPTTILWFRVDMAHPRECPINGPFTLSTYADFMDFLEKPATWHTTPFGSMYRDIERAKNIDWYGFAR